MCSKCNGIGFFIYIWTTVEGVIQKWPQILATTQHRFIVPCATCSLSAYSSWLVKNNTKLVDLNQRLIGKAMFIASRA